MYKYRNLMVGEIWQFAKPKQQEDVFRAVMSSADGLVHRGSNTWRTLLHYMATNGVADILRATVDAGFDVNGEDSDDELLFI